MTEVERVGWRLDRQMDMWLNGRHGIGLEVIAGWRREQVQQYAIEKTGQPLPDEAFEIGRDGTCAAIDQERSKIGSEQAKVAT